MNSGLQILIISVLCIIGLKLCPWWITFVISLFSFLILFKHKRSLKAFLVGFISGFIAWLILILIKDFPNEHVLSSKIAEMFYMPNFIVLIIVNALIGGITCGLGAWLGNLFHVKR
jgi:hypothetical protein